MRRRRAGLPATLALVALACGGDPEPASAPPEPAPVELDLAVADVDVELDPRTRLSEVTAFEGGFLATGVIDHGDSTDGVLLRSDDGVSWRAAAPGLVLEGYWPVDVAASDRARVAVGSRWRGDASDALFLASVDGTTWPLLEPARYGGIDGSVQWVAAGPDGFLAGGVADADGAAVRWTSPDGQVWTVVDGGPDPTDALAVGAAWVGVGAVGGRPAGLASADGVTWTGVPLDGGGSGGEPVAASAIAVGSDGMVIVGIESEGCGPFASCPGLIRGWWSADGARWAREPDDVWRFAGPVEVTSADGLIYAVHAAGLDVSRDGWHWQTVLEGPWPIGGEAAIAVRDGTIVVVGEHPAGGSTIVTAVPASP